MKKIAKICILALSIAVVATGCSVDEQVNEFAEATNKMVEEVEAAGSAEEAQAAFDTNMEVVTPLWDKLKDARGFQISEESQETLAQSTVDSVSGVCALTLRGAFDEEEKGAYEKMCDQYAEMVEVSSDTAMATVMDQEYAVESFAESLEEAREEAQEDESSMLSCASLETHEETATKHGFEDEFAEYEELCNVTGPTNFLRTAVEQAEAARAEDPDESVLSECYNATQESALESLEEAGVADSDEVTDLAERWEEACG